MSRMIRNIVKNRVFEERVKCGFSVFGLGVGWCFFTSREQVKQEELYRRIRDDIMDGKIKKSV